MPYTLTISIPEDIKRYIDSKKDFSPSRFFQEKVREEIKKEKK